jgi:hypothetical protein
MTDPIPWPTQRRLVLTLAPPYAVVVVLVWLLQPKPYDIVTAAARPAVDAIFVIDDSESMGEDQEALERHARAVVEAVGADVDLRVAVVTTSVRNERRLTFLAATDPTLPAAMRVGTMGESHERGRDALLGALDRASHGEGDALRPGATLLVAIFSDEPDQSLTPAPTLASYLAALTGSAPVSLLAVTTTDAMASYRDIVAPFGGRVINLDGAWAGTARDVAAALSRAGQIYALPGPLLASTVKVTVDGEPVVGWVLRGASLELTTPLPAGTHLTVLGQRDLFAELSLFVVGVWAAGARATTGQPPWYWTFSG